jgi:16S rRNA (guanine527-N7)-methyltransferase
VRSAEFRRRLLGRLSPLIHLTDRQIGQLELYYLLLARWNRKINLTALPLEPLGAATLDRLFVEPLAAGDDVPDGSSRWVDLGSGGGSPAVPLKIVREAADLLMIESRSRKAAFLREVIREVELPNSRVIGERFESIPRELVAEKSIDLVTVRAVRPDAGLVGFIERVLALGGRLLLFGSTDMAEILKSQNLQLRDGVSLPWDDKGRMKSYRVFHVEHSRPE